MVSLDVSETSKALAITGAYIVFVGLVSYFVKNRLFLSEALLAVCLGIITGPIALNWFSPFEWTSHNQESLNEVTFQITRIVIGIQVLFAGIALPKAYLRREWLSIAMVLGPIMICAWFVSSLLIWGLIPGLTFLESLVIGSCITPTDPVLANSICKGRFAEKHVALHVRNILVAESGANDGLGYPFLYLALYLILRHYPAHPVHTIGGAIGEWFYNIVLYEIVLSVVIGFVIGFLARKALKWCEQRELVDHENFLAFGVGLTFFTLGIVGMIGSDDLLCCFIVGNSFTWDDWFRVQTEDHAFQDVIDTLVTSAVFLYIGAILPWSEFGNFYNISPWRLVVLGIAVMLVRRVPWMMALHKWIPTLPSLKEAAFAGFFGPIGVSAVFYVQVALKELPEERTNLVHVITPVVYFMVLTSVVVHGITIPIGKGFGSVTRTLTFTRSFTSNNNLVSRLPKAPSTLPVRTEPETESRNEQLFDIHDETDPGSYPVVHANDHIEHPGSDLGASGSKHNTVHSSANDAGIRFQELPKKNDGSTSEIPPRMPKGGPVSILASSTHGPGTPGRGTPKPSRPPSPQMNVKPEN